MNISDNLLSDPYEIREGRKASKYSLYNQHFSVKLKALPYVEVSILNKRGEEIWKKCELIHLFSGHQSSLLLQQLSY